MSQIEVTEPITKVLKLIVDDQHKRSVGGRGNIRAPPPQARRDAMVQSISRATVYAGSEAPCCRSMVPTSRGRFNSTYPLLLLEGSAHEFDSQSRAER